MNDKLIYLDNAATTKVYDEVADIMDKSLREDYFNPSAFYKQSLKVEKDIEAVRKSLANLLGFNPNELYFTSGATESNNTILKGVIDSAREPFNIIASSIEHPSVMEVLNDYKDKGVDIRLIPVDDRGNLDLDWLEDNIDDQTALVTVMGANNEIGTILDLPKVKEIIDRKGPNALFHVDFVQAFLKSNDERLNLKKIKPDAVSITAHKIHGPKGIGALALRKNKRVKPLILGGGQESKFRSGTENAAGIVGFGKAAEVLSSHLDDNEEKLKELKAYFLEQLGNNVDDFIVNTPENSVPGLVCVSINGIRAEVLLHMLEDNGILISAGSACSTHKKDSYVHKALGFNKDRSEGTIRISFSEFNTKEDVDKLISVIGTSVKNIRRLLGFKR